VSDRPQWPRGGRPGPREARPEPPRPDRVSARVTVDVHHVLEGPDDGRPLVLLNSLGTDHGMWDDQAGPLAERYRLVRYDQRGHGQSPVPRGPYSIADLGADLIALLDRLGIERASLCGLSLGGMTAMWVASEVPERLDRLVLCCTSALLGPASDWQQRARTVRGLGVGAIADAVLTRWFTPAFLEARPPAVDRLDAMLRAQPAEGYAGCCEAIRDMDLTDRLARITAPTLVIAGAQDPATPPLHGQAIASSVPDGRLEVVPDAAHLASVEQPAAITERILAHVG
jgi:3-oxoadipate enol-lactonase